MDTRKYEAVLRIVERKNFARAAEDLGYTQSALSQMVASLENEIGFKLIERSRTGSHLTLEGETLLPFMEQVLNAQRSFQERAAQINGLEIGVVRIGTIASISAHWLPSLIREFEHDHPGVKFVIHQGDYTLIPEWINSGLIDFGFVNPSGVSGLQTKLLKSGSMSAVLPKEHRLCKHKAIPLRELAKEPFILLEEGAYYEPLEAFAACGCEPQVKYTIHDDYSIMAMVEQGLGVTILADLIMRGCPYDLVTRPTEPPITRDIALAWKDTARLPIAAKRFMDLLEQRAQVLP
ncbi:LysR family transcriptional regulator [Anaerotardibacter muris]|uniref:LysR family transcriptional regulator n=1 Tax=Anaerotardibacter muris TaxID=2941505 RepID=UPI00203CF245|nr:LysR family transcriptional regulator [Anaerotardibacter muris]